MIIFIINLDIFKRFLLRKRIIKKNQFEVKAKDHRGKNKSGIRRRINIIKSDDIAFGHVKILNKIDF